MARARDAGGPAAGSTIDTRIDCFHGALRGGTRTLSDSRFKGMVATAVSFFASRNDGAARPRSI